MEGWVNVYACDGHTWTGLCYASREDVIRGTSSMWRLVARLHVRLKENAR